MADLNVDKKNNEKNQDSIKLVIGGDLFPTPVNYELFSEGNVKAIFGEEVNSIFSAADYAVCNLEGCFTDSDTVPKVKDGPKIRAPKKSIKAIKELGVDCVSLANNHATDFELKGFKDTCDVLDESSIAYFGAGENIDSVTTHHSVEIKGKKITFYGVAETLENVPTDSRAGVNIYDEYRVCNEIRELKKSCDYLVVLYHGGIERFHYNTPSIRERFHRMADNGADILFSQHTHAVGEEEYYKKSYMLYGQGNFCFHFSKHLSEWVLTGLFTEIDFHDDGFQVKNHMVRREGDHIVYEGQKNMAEFDERSRRLSGGDTFDEEFRQFADGQLLQYLEAFRGYSLGDKIAKKVLSSKGYKKHLKKKYSEKNILRILRTMECEEFRELVTKGLHNMLEEK